MSLNIKKPSYLFIAWLIVFSGFYIALKISFGILICDDAYITLSHVRTWVEQGRPVISLLNPVNATSTPLFTALLSLLAMFFGVQHIIIIAYCALTFFEVCSIALVFRIAKNLQLPLPYTLLAVSAYGMSVGLYSMSSFGMEAMLYVFLALYAHYYALFYEKKIYTIIPVLFAVTLVRPEGLLVVFSVLVICFVKKEKMPVLGAYCAASVAGLLLFFLFYYLSYGAVLPHSVVAKRIQLDIGLTGAFHAWKEYAFLKGPVFGGRRIMILVNCAICIAAAGGFLREKRFFKVLFLLIWPVTYMGFFLITGSSDPLMPWYFFPVVPFFILVITFGIYRLLARFPIKQAAVWALPFCMVSYCFAQVFIQKIPYKYRCAGQFREQRYRDALQVINPAASNNDVIMIDEVGTVGFHGKYRILDSHGLLSPEVLPFLKKYKNYIDYDKDKMLLDTFLPDWFFYTRGVAYLKNRDSEGEKEKFKNYTLFREIANRESPFVLELWRKKRYDQQ